MAQKSPKSAPRRTTAKKKAKAATKKAVAQSRSAPAAPRRLKPALPRRFGFRKPIKHPVRLPNAWQLTKLTANILWQNRLVFLGIIGIYAVLNLIFVQGLTSTADIISIKNTAAHAVNGHWRTLASGFSVLSALIGSAGNGSSQTVGIYQVVLGLMASLAIIWALREVLAGSQIRIRDAYYRGMYPVVPFILVLVLIGVQLIPLGVGAKLYNTVVAGGIAIGFFEKGFWLLLFLGLGFWSLYMVSSSIFALYIVTLPNMTPMRAIRSARGLVKHRRLQVLRKVLCLPVILLVVAAIIMLPVIIWVTALATWVFYLLSLSVLVAVHGYMYTLYRELLND